VIVGNKYNFISNDKRLSFNGNLPKLPHNVIQYALNKNLLFTERIPKSYFNIIMEKIYFVDHLDIFNYQTINTISFLTFIKAVMEGIIEISDKHIVHGDIHILRNIGFFKAIVNEQKVLLPKLVDFGVMRHTGQIYNYDNGRFVGCIQLKYRPECPPELNGQLDNAFNYDEKRLRNKVWNKNKTCGNDKSDLYMFFNGIVLMDFLKLNTNTNLPASHNINMDKHHVINKYYIVGDEMYNALHTEILNLLHEHVKLNNYLFINQGSITDFVKKFAELIMSSINPNHRLRPSAKSVVDQLTKFIKTYFVKSESILFLNSKSAYDNQK
jgi:hypothetical protein